MSSSRLTSAHLDFSGPTGAQSGSENNRTLTILRLLVEHRFLTTHQFYSLLGQKWPQQTRRDLARARKQRFIKSFAYQPEQGHHSELCWQLTPGGVRFLEEADGVHLGYNAHFWRKPGLERIRQRNSELELEQQVKAAGWRIIRPRTYNQHKALPNYTRQYKAIAAALTIIEQRRKAGVVVDPNGPHTLCIPLKTNEYVAQSQDRSQAVMLILCPPRVGESFWAERLKKYGLLAREIPVVGVFSESTSARLYQPILEEGKLVVTTLDRVKSGLTALG